MMALSFQSHHDKIVDVSNHLLHPLSLLSIDCISQSIVTFMRELL